MTIEEILISYQEMVDRVVALHVADKHGRCVGCDNRCGCYEGDLDGINTWETCPTLEALKGETK